MRKLHLLILALLLFSCILHHRQMRRKNIPFPSYLKNLLIGDPPIAGSSRLVYMDVIRLLATCFVIAIHALESAAAELTAGSTAWLVTQAFSAVFLLCNILFIMSSGALVLGGKEEPLSVFYCRRFAKVAIPFFCYYGVYILLSGQYFENGLLSGMAAVIKQMISGPITWTPHLWVIYVILSLYILAPFFRIMVKHLSDQMLEALVFLLFLFQCLSTYLPVFSIHLGVGLMIQTWESIFLLGYYFNHPVSAKRTRLFLVLGAASYACSLLCIKFRADYKTLLYMDGAPTMLFMSGAIFLLLRRLENRLPSSHILLRFVSRYSYSILLIHWAVLYFVRDILGVTEAVFGLAGGTVLSALLVFVLSGAAAVIFDQTAVLCVRTVYEKFVFLIQAVKNNTGRDD